jgi:hypothetical protein
MNKFEKIVKIVTMLIALILLAFIGGCFLYPRYVRWQFDHLEEHASRVITASELETWATNLLAKYPTYSVSQIYQMRTDYPAQLRSLCPVIGPTVFIGEDWNSEDFKIHPTFVNLYWGGTPIGHGGFEIGPTNFVSHLHPNAHAWAPGVYFYREKD